MRGSAKGAERGPLEGQVAMGQQGYRRPEYRRVVGVARVATGGDGARAAGGVPGVGGAKPRSARMKQEWAVGAVTTERQSFESDAQPPLRHCRMHDGLLHFFFAHGHTPSHTGEINNRWALLRTDASRSARRIRKGLRIP